MIRLKCKYCKIEKEIPNYRKLTFKYCSRKCKDLDLLGHIPWNKGIKYDEKLKAKLNINGLIIGRKKRKGIIYKTNYRNIHYWARKNKVGNKICSVCSKNYGVIELSNIDHKYRLKIEDYVYMCPKCHRQYDRKMKLNSK